METGLVWQVGLAYVEAFEYAGVTALTAPSLSRFKRTIVTCESFAQQHNTVFNLSVKDKIAVQN